MKDPLYTEDTPYDILYIHRNISQKEVQRALGEHLKKKKNLREGMNAANTIRSVKDRIEVDFFYYCLGDIEPNRRDSDFNVSIQSFIDVPLVDIDYAFTDLRREDISDDFKEINYRELKIKNLERYYDVNEINLEIMFDK